MVYQFLSGGRVSVTSDLQLNLYRNMGILLAKLWNLFGNEGKQVNAMCMLFEPL